MKVILINERALTKNLNNSSKIRLKIEWERERENKVLKKSEFLNITYDTTTSIITLIKRLL